MAPTSKYPRWELAWQRQLPEIDKQILDFCESCSGEPMQSLSQLKAQLGDWVDSQQLDPQTRAEFAKAKQAPEYLENKLGQRMTQLMQQGRLMAGSPASMSPGAQVDNPQAAPAVTQAQDGEYPPRYPPEFRPERPATPHPGDPGDLPDKGPQAGRSPQVERRTPNAAGSLTPGPARPVTNSKAN